MHGRARVYVVTLKKLRLTSSIAEKELSSMTEEELKQLRFTAPIPEDGLPFAASLSDKKLKQLRFTSPISEKEQRNEGNHVAFVVGWW